MDIKFIIACCVFSFITGMYATHTIEKGRGCSVLMTRGQVTTVTLGDRNGN
jgi:hypothetical protein